MKTILQVLVLTPLLFVSSCTNSSNPVGPGPGTGGKIFAGPSVDLGSQTIGTSGGTFTINKPGDTLNGFQIIVPANGFAQAQTFAVSYAPITSHQLGSLINPISPLITITYGGGYSADEMKVKVPIKLPAGSFAMGFFYDATTGELEPLSVAGLDSSSITIATRHLSPSDAKLSKGLRKSANVASGTIFVSYILLKVLGSQTVISSAFTPGVDDWEFPNYGSHISSGGQCAGQCASAIWYYYSKKLKGSPGLFHQYDKIDDPLRPDSIWFDNPIGYRFASTVQEDINQDHTEFLMNVESWVPDLVFDAFVYSMLVTGRPQMVFVVNSSGQGGHALVVYKIDVLGGRLYVADPNFPNNRDPLQHGAPVVPSIEYVQGYVTGSFKPYSIETKVGDPPILCDQIGYAAVSAHINWAKIAQRWTEFQSGTIGNDRFPAYTLYEDHTGAQFTDGLDTDLDSIKISCVCLTCPFYEDGTFHGQVVNGYDSLGRLLGTTTGGHLTLALRPGDNTFGLYIMGTPADGKDHYVDFKWMKVHRHMTLTIASTEANGAPVSTSGVKNKLYTFIAKSAKPVPKDGKVRYDWKFGDNPTVVVSANNDSTTTHSFAQDGTYTVGVTFYYDGTNISSVSATAKIAAAPPAITSIVPSTAKVGDTVKVKGKNFGSDQTKGSVTFTSAVTATGIIGWVDTMITVKVPLGVQTGPVTVTVNSQTSNAVAFSLLPPTITSIIPATGKVADTVKVIGKYFGIDPTKGSVTFNGITATGILSWVDTVIVFKVPQGAQTGPVTVTVNGVTSNAVTFTIAGVPVITSLTPSTARVKDTISIDGNNFGTDKTKGYIQFTGTTAYSTGIVSWTNTNIKVVVPYNVVTGPLSVNVNSIASNQVLFTLDTTPWIDQVYHSGQAYLGSPKRSWALPGSVISIAGRNFGWPDTAKVQFNNLTVPVYGFTPDFESVLAPSAVGGAVNVSVKTKSGLVSNSRPFYVGVPFDTLKTHRRVRIDIEFFITYNDKFAGGPQTTGLVFGGTANVTWGTNGFAANASDFSPTKTGTLKATLSPDGTRITRLELNYVNLAPPYESIQYIGEDIVGRLNSVYTYVQLEYYVKGYDAVRSLTRQLTGTYTPLQTAYPIDGLKEGYDSYISIMIMDLDVS